MTYHFMKKCLFYLVTAASVVVMSCNKDKKDLTPTKTGSTKISYYAEAVINGNTKNLSLNKALNTYVHKKSCRCCEWR